MSFYSSRKNTFQSKHIPMHTFGLQEYIQATVQCLSKGFALFSYSNPKQSWSVFHLYLNSPSLAQLIIRAGTTEWSSFICDLQVVIMVPLALNICVSDEHREKAGWCSEQDVSCSAANTQLTHLGPVPRIHTAGVKSKDFNYKKVMGCLLVLVASVFFFMLHPSHVSSISRQKEGNS